MKLGNYESNQARASQAKPMGAAAFGAQQTTTVTWLGAAGVLINCRGTLVMIDPVLSVTSDDPAISETGEPLLVELPIAPAAIPNLDAVLYTHADNDHLGPLTAPALLHTGAVYHGSALVNRELASMGIPADRMAACRTNDSFAIGPLRITVTPAFHPHQLHRVDYSDYFSGDDCCGYRVETPDGIIWIPGDTMLLPEHLKMTDVDLLFWDIGDNFWHLGLDGALALANVLEQAELILFHFGTFHGPGKPWHNGNPASVQGRLRRPERLHVLAPGEGFAIAKKEGR